MGVFRLETVRQLHRLLVFRYKESVDEPRMNVSSVTIHLCRVWAAYLSNSTRCCFEAFYNSRSRSFWKNSNRSVLIFRSKRSPNTEFFTLIGESSGEHGRSPNNLPNISRRDSHERSHVSLDHYNLFAPIHRDNGHIH